MPKLVRCVRCPIHQIWDKIFVLVQNLDQYVFTIDLSKVPTYEWVNHPYNDI